MTTELFAVTDESGKAINVYPLYRYACDAARTGAIFSGKDRLVKRLETEEEQWDAYYEVENG